MDGDRLLRGPIPFDYLFEKLAIRWHTTPIALEREMEADPRAVIWVRRGIIFMRLEAVDIRER